MAVALLTGACAPPPSGPVPPGSDAPVVAAIYPIAFLAGQIVDGTSVPVIDLTPPGIEPHDSELTADDLKTLSKAAMVIYLAGGFQPSIDRSLATLPPARPEQIDALSGLDPIFVDDRGGPDPGNGTAGQSADRSDQIDPHFWLDPLRMEKLAVRVSDRLGELDPPNAQSYRDGAALLSSRLRELDAKYRAGLANCDSRTIVTSHASFGYLAQRYELTQVAIAGMSPDAEPTPDQLRQVIDAIRRTGSSTVFVEPLASPRLADTIARETGATTTPLDPIEGLTDEALRRGDNYYSIMAANLANIRGALGCK